MTSSHCLKRQFASACGESDLLKACESVANRWFPDRSVWSNLNCLRSHLATFDIEIKSNLKCPHEGLIEFRPSGKTSITIRPAKSKSRNRFTIAHEIGHWLVRKTVCPNLVAGSETAYRGIKYSAADRVAEETLANLLAAELLLPREKICAAFESSESLHTISDALAAQSGASKVVVLRRVADVLERNVAWLRIIGVPTSNHGTYSEIDDALFARGGFSTLWARESTWLNSPADFGSLWNQASACLSFQSPVGTVSGEFELRQSHTPLRNLELVGIGARQGCWNLATHASV